MYEIFARLSAGGRRFHNFIVRGIREGLSGAEILRLIRKEFGVAYRIQDFYADLRILKGAMQRWDTIKYVRNDRMPSERTFFPGLKVHRGNYQMRFYYEVRDREGNVIFSDYTTVVRNTNTIMGEWKRQALEQIIASVCKTRPLGPRCEELEFYYVPEQALRRF